jgi:hypothetical protein
MGVHAVRGAPFNPRDLPSGARFGLHEPAGSCWASCTFEPASSVRCPGSGLQRPVGSRLQAFAPAWAIWRVCGVSATGRRWRTCLRRTCNPLDEPVPRRGRSSTHTKRRGGPEHGHRHGRVIGEFRGRAGHDGWATPGDPFRIDSLHRCCVRKDSRTCHIEPGAPWQNHYVESYYGHLGRELLSPLGISRRQRSSAGGGKRTRIQSHEGWTEVWGAVNGRMADPSLPAHRAYRRVLTREQGTAIPRMRSIGLTPSAWMLRAQVEAARGGRFLRERGRKSGGL